MEIKPIETRYHGHKFRSRLEARWAVFFDACGIEWEYEPQGYDLGDGVCYLPDFLLHSVQVAGGDTKGDIIDLYVEVKGKTQQNDYDKLARFVFNGEGRRVANPTLVVGDIPAGETFDEMCWEMLRASDDWRDLMPRFNGGMVAAVNCFMMPGIHYEPETGSTLWLFSEAREGISRMNCGLDEDRTFAAYRRASEARFEHGESPETRRV